MNPHFRISRCLLAVVAISTSFAARVVFAQETAFRPPAVPLVACDPYFSIWSQADTLWQSRTTHWTGKSQRLAAMVRVDGTAYRLMGASPQTIAAMKQTSVEVLPTRTIYQFAGHSVTVKLTFTTPALPGDLMILSRPTTYVNCEVSSQDGKTHDVEFYLDANGELTTNQPDQQVIGSRESFSNATGLKIGSVTQQVLGKSGDDLRIDWGYLYVAAPSSRSPSLGFGKPAKLREAFDASGAATATDNASEFPVNAGDVVSAVAMSIGSVGSEPASCFAVLAYDDLYSIEFMGNRLRPYWRKNGWNASDLIQAAIDQHDELERRCADFDSQLMVDLERAGGREYAQIGALAYRQCFAAGKFVADANGQPLQFSKENHSNGCIATSDVFYPMAPQFLLFGPTLTKSFLVPFMEYAASERWRFPFAPHDLGTYPKANGQRYGGGETSEENQMPVEECGNLLLLFGALAQMEGHADFAAIYWQQLSQWASYLRDKGFDPENQLCTDDFAGHMAHNVNLSAKAICALGAYAQLCERRGLKDAAQEYRATAEKYAAQWVNAARDGDHFRLAFDRSGTWSQKYNLVWDRILGLKLFPDEVYETEMSYYRKIQNRFGLPLDNRSDYTKLDWILWTATLTEKRDDFGALVRPVHRFLQETPDRSPMTDWYFTSTARKRGFTARPVVGGVFLRLLYGSNVWQKYASMDVTRASGWAKMPRPPRTKTLVATGASAEGETAKFRYTTQQPPDDWHQPEFDDSSWKEGLGGFGTRQTPGAPVKTTWNSNDIWLRRTVTVSEIPNDRIALRLWHDEDVEVYINGQRVADLGGYTTGYELVELKQDALRPGANKIAIHCHQTTGGQFVDFGIVAIDDDSTP
ncbi:MAG: DUF4965 domain-containing protein [Planctomycetales bacterium]|nr:DUF4965 domain-containing protein [Planctomycetales bacterium]